MFTSGVKSLSLLLLQIVCLTYAQQVIVPAPNGTYNVGRVTLEMTNEASIQIFAPAIEAPRLELSIFYPTHEKRKVNVPYMPSAVARYQDFEQYEYYGINSPNGTFERLLMQLAPEGSAIARSRKQWPLLIFGSADGTNRNFYNALVSQVASSGYVIVTYDTPYTTDIIEYDDDSTTLGNKTYLSDSNYTTLFPWITDDVNVRAQDTSYMISRFSNDSFVSSTIPGCKACLDTAHVGVFGHSIGGAVAATVMLNDSRIAGALDFDGTLWGDVVQEGLSKPFMLMVEEGNNRDAFDEYPGNSWEAIWPNLKSARFDLILNNSAHYTYSDYPLVFELLDILPTNETILEDILLTSINGSRALHIVTTYAIAFFDWLLKDGSADLIAAPSSLFPEISLDTNTTSLEEASSIQSGFKLSATPTSGWILYR